MLPLAVLCPLFWLELLHKQVHVDPHHVTPAPAMSGLLPIVNPPLRGKVGRLSTVEPMVEATVVPVREGNDEVTCLLHHLRSDGGLRAGTQRDGNSTLLNGMEYCLRTDGEMSVILCLRKLEHSS